MRASTSGARAGWCGGGVLAALLGAILLSAPAPAGADQDEGEPSSAGAADLKEVLSPDEPSGNESSDGEPSGGGAADDAASGGESSDGQSPDSAGSDGEASAGDASSAGSGDEAGEAESEGSGAASSGSAGAAEAGGSADGSSDAEDAEPGESGSGAGSGAPVRSLPKVPELEPLEPEEAEALGHAEARQRSVRVLVRAAMGDDAALRSNAIEAMELMPDRALPLTNKALNDPNPAVRFAAAVTAAKLGFESLVPTLKPLLKDENESVRAAALSALHKLGEDVNLTPLAGMLRSREPQLRSNVALLLGLLGDESAVPMLKRAASAPLRRASAARAAVVRVQVAEAIARLDHDAALDALRAGMFSQFGEVRVVAVNATGAIGDERMQPALANMLEEEQPVELELAAAAALARMGASRGLERVLERSEHERPAIRSQVAWALGWFDGEQGLPTLKRLLADASPQVRVSAAASVLRRLGSGSGP